MGLKRNIGTFGILFSAVGGVIGSGWLFGPFYAAKIAGPAAILSWLIGGFLMMFIALTFAELATMFPIAGGVARFSHFSHGSLVSFTMSWCGWLSSIVVAPIETMALLQYASNYIPNIVENFEGTHILTGSGIALAASLMLIMCFINYFGIKWVSKINNAIVVIKLAVPILTLILLFTLNFNIQNFTSFGFAPYGIKGILTALPTAGVIFSFIGYNPAIQLAGEAKNPRKMIPIAIIGALSITLILYVFIQTSFIGAVEPDLETGWKNLAFSKDNGPFVGLAAGMGLTWLVVVLYLDAIISPFGTALIYTSSAGRINYAMSQNGYMPQSMRNLSKRGVPLRAIFLNYIMGLILFLPFPGWQNMVEFLVSAFIISYAVGPIALIALRDRLPEQKRVFKVPFPHIFCLIAFYICNLLAFWTGWKTMGRILLAIGLGYLFLFFYKKRVTTLNLFFRNGWWLFLYLLGLGMLSYVSTFGGGIGLIPFGWDFAFLAGFTLIIFYLAKSLALQGSDIKEILGDVVNFSHIKTESFEDSLPKE